MSNITPILVNNGVTPIACDGVMHFGWNTPLTNKLVIGAYLFGNLITDPSVGADVILWSASYENNYPPPYQGGPSSQWGSIADLHIFSAPAGKTGNARQGVSERWFPAGSGILINGDVQLAVIGWGGGTLECYAEIFVVDAP